MPSRSREDLALVVSLSRSYQQFIRSMAPVFKMAGLTPSQWDVLETLYSKGALSVNELIAAVLSSSGNVDVIVKNLIAAGLVDKTVDQRDCRKRILSLTDEGHAQVEAFYPTHNEALGLIFDHIPAAEKRAHIKALNRLRKQIKPTTHPTKER